MQADRPFRASDVLTRDEIRELTRSSNLAGLFAVVWTWSIIAASFLALARWPHPLTFVGVVIILGGRQLALAVMMHEGAHGTLFRTKVLNDKLVDWLCARPVWSDIARYRKHHLQHHAHTGTERDPDLGLALAKPMTPRSLRRKIARDLLGATGAKRVIGLVAIDAELLTYDVGARPKPPRRSGRGGGKGHFDRPRRAPWRGAAHHAAALARNLWKPLVANAALYGALAYAGHAWLYLAWLAAYLTTFSLFVRVRSLAEHACMERGAEPLTNTRTTRAGLLARLTVAPLNVNLHLEHHLLPTVPWQRLPRFHRMLAERGVIPARSLARDYRDVLRTVSAAR